MLDSGSHVLTLNHTCLVSGLWWRLAEDTSVVKCTAAVLKLTDHRVWS